MNPEMVSGFYDIEREIEKRFIVGFRSVFVYSNLFKYNNNDKESKVIITPDFPSKEYDGKIPQIVVSSVSFASSTDIGLSDGFNTDVSMFGIANYQSEHYIKVNYSATFLCYGIYDSSRNLANELFYWLRVRAKKYFSDNLKLNMRDISKQPTGPDSQFPEKIFRTPVTVSGSLELAMTTSPYDYYTGKDELGNPIGNIELGTEVEK